MKSYTGGVVSMGLGLIHCRSSKKKLNTKSSTEAEIVGASDYVPYNIWYFMFMHHQGYLNKPNKFFPGQPKLHEEESEREELLHRKISAY